MPESWQNTVIMASTKPTSALRARRLQYGLTQAELAARAEVSRQLVVAVESGQNMPAADAAIRLARALATTVEDLFASTPSPVVAALGVPLREGALMRVGVVGDRLVAAALPDHGIAGAGWARPDGMVEASGPRLFPGATPRGFVLAGCDPALGVAEAMLEGLGSSSLLSISAATGVALSSLARGGVHAAVVHGPSGGLPEPPVPVQRLHLARWEVGLAAAPKLRRKSLQGLLDGGVAIAQRDPSAASQQSLERAAVRAGRVSPLPGPVVEGHIAAARTASALECAAVTIEAAARSFDLRFLPIEEHVVEVWVANIWREHPGFIALGNILASRAFTERIAHFGGYDLRECGTRPSS